MELLFHRGVEGFEYVMDDFNKSTKRIWVINHTQEFVYREGAGPPRSVWGFYRPRTKEYFAPINSKKIGKKVRIEDTTPFTAMKVNYNPLEQALYGNS
jgi:hypothetical protein